MARSPLRNHNRQVTPRRSFVNRAFVIRLSNEQRKMYAAGSQLEVGETGNLTAIDPSGNHWTVRRERWLDVVLDADEVVTNRWNAQRRGNSTTLRG
jgi:hypothetical protein